MKGIPIDVVRKSKIETWEKQIHDYQQEVNLATQFVKAIRQGDLNTGYVTHNGNHLSALGQSLVQMRDQMKKISEEEKQRTWATQGLAQFIGILQEDNSDLSQLTDRIIQYIVKYMHVNNGALYLIEGEGEDEFLEMKACVAYGQKKYINQRFEIGSGVIGQAVVEKETVHLTNVPKNYVKISSGLGASLPTNVLIVPLMTQKKVMGVIELASFETILPHQISFLEKASESIAITILNLKSNERTRKLLEETKEQAEQMRQQEEEMRQNMEELTATQEEMRRAQAQTEKLLKESQEKTEALLAQEEELRQNMEEMTAQQELIAKQMGESERMRKELEVREEVFGYTTILSETDTFGTITHVNSKFCEVSEYSAQELLGKPQNIVRHPDMPKELFRLFWDTIKQGKVFHGIIKNRKKLGGHYWVDAHIVPVKNDEGKIVKYIGARYHIQSDVLAEQMYREQMERLGFN